MLQRRGELVACKVFRSDVSPREDLARQREFKVMMELKHENIVKFISVEQEVRCRHQQLTIYIKNTNRLAQLEMKLK